MYVDESCMLDRLTNNPDITDAQLLFKIIEKSAGKIPYSEIAAEFGTTPIAVRSKINRLKRKYKDGTVDFTGATDDEDDTEVPVVPKKRKRAVKAEGNPDREEEKVKSEEDKEDGEAEVKVSEDEK